MANKRITDVDVIDSLNSDESFFINQNNSIKQINKNNILFGVTNGGTGATTSEQARNNLGITPANIGAKASGSVEKIETGGTGATDAATARANLGAVAITNIAVNLAVDGWVNNQQSVNVDSVTADNIVIIAPDSNVDNYDDYLKYGIRCITQAENTLTFLCNEVPDVTIIVNVAIFY